MTRHPAAIAIIEGLAIGFGLAISIIILQRLGVPQAVVSQV